LPLFDRSAERNDKDQYVILFAAHDLCFPESRIGDWPPAGPMGTWFALFKAVIKNSAESRADELEEVLCDAVEHVRNHLRGCGIEIPPQCLPAGRQEGLAGVDVSATANPKRKRSTERGEGRTKLIAALTTHHQYADGGCLNAVPIGNNELARLAKVADATASAFFKKEFGGYAKYRVACGDTRNLVTALKLLMQEFSPHILFGRTPPGEGEPDDEQYRDLARLVAAWPILP
jgi:hypothetical protein